MGKQNQGPSHDKRAKKMPLFPFQMLDVRLRSVNAEAGQPTETEESHPLKITLLTEIDTVPDKPFRIGLAFQVNNLRAGDESFSLSMVIEGLFRITVDPEEVDEETFERFIKGDVILLLWPFLREAVYDITRRMGLEVSPLPLIDARQLLVAPVLFDEDEEEGD